MLTLFRIAADDTALKPDGGRLPLPVSPTSMCRLATGRSALTHLIDRLPHPHATTVLLPCYVAEGVIKPFLVSGFTIMFYRLRPDLTPLVEDVDAMLGQVHGNAVFVLIHYFGFSARSVELSSVLLQHAPIVVEDCAHAAFTTTLSGEPLGTHPGITLYSLNKFLPVVDGALLISYRTDLDVSLDEKTLPELPEDAQQAYRAHLKLARYLFECNDPVQAKALLQNLGDAYQQYYEMINADLSPFRQSALSRRIEDAFPYDHLIRQRLLNSRVVYEGLRTPEFSLVYPVLPLGTVPFCIPARVFGLRREEILARLFDQGILLSTLQNKWDFVPDHRRNQFPVETAFLEDHVLIPVSEFISTAAMQSMVERLNCI